MPPVRPGPYRQPGVSSPSRESFRPAVIEVLDDGDVAKSWVDSGQNQPISPGPLASALGPSIIKALAKKTGLSEQEVAAQLSQALPGFVDKLTPQGRLPTHEELARFGG